MSLKTFQSMLKNARSYREVLKLFTPVRWNPPRVLNAVNASQSSSDSSKISALEVVKSMKKLSNRLKGSAINEETGIVSYASLATSDTFRELEALAAQLANISVTDIPMGPERTAFFLNLYNVLVIHGIIALQIQKTVLEIPTFFRAVAYNISGINCTPDDIEHGILRVNAPHPSRKGNSYFDKGDVRLQWKCSESIDPRIHAALVCGSKSCPPIRFYDGENLDSQLDTAASLFVQNEVTVDVDRKTIGLSMIFKWYAADFGGQSGVFSFIKGYRPELRDVDFSAFAVTYADYNWSLNHA